MAEARRSPFVWVTWITSLLSADDACRWRAWFKAHFKYDKVERLSNDLTRWKAEHGAMVDAVAADLRASGWTVYLEAQNKFFLNGKSATLSGTPDVVAVRGEQAIVIDCKSGEPRDADFWQVCLYLVALPRTHKAVAGKELSGEVRYRDRARRIAPIDLTADVQARIFAQLRECGADVEPARVPSARECRFCDIPASECAVRVEAQADEPVYAHDMGF